MEVINRFETHILNTSEEGVEFVKEVDKDNVKVMLDTFHMNIEEVSIGDAIRHAEIFWDTCIQANVTVWYREKDVCLGEKSVMHYRILNMTGM